MPLDPECTYEIEFDDRGRIRIMDPELARRLLLQASEGRETEVLIETGPEKEGSLPVVNESGCPKPLNSSNCPNPINGSGCPNSMCPLTLKVIISKTVLPQWTKARE
jgi:hypothetical protein